MKETTELTIKGTTGEAKIPFSTNDLIITDRNVYKVDLLCSITKPEDVKEGVAYIDEDLFYVFKGDYNEKYDTEPGIYIDGKQVRIIHPKTAEEREDMTYADKLAAFDIMSMAAMVDAGLDEIEYDASDCGRIFAPPIEMNDDILKRAIKSALLLKRVDIDNRRDRFVDKNALFNAKQVIKNNQKLSAMLFTRWCDALNLDYEIVLSESSSGKPVGTPLEEPIRISSTDTF